MAQMEIKAIEVVRQTRDWHYALPEGQIPRGYQALSTAKQQLVAEAEQLYRKNALPSRAAIPPKD